MIIKYREMRKKSKGFTLIELMIVVAIIAILAAIAIPQYRKFQMKSKTSEAKTNIGAIRTAEEAYAAEHDKYVLADWDPGQSAVANGNAVNWGDGGASGYGFDTIGFKPAGKVRYSYGVGANSTTVPTNSITDASNVTATDGNDDILIQARGDLDGDNTYVTFYCTDEDPEIQQHGSGF